MTNVVYVRVRSADPIAKVQAERAERFESRGVMVLHNFTFEQFGDSGNEVESFGWAGTASVHIESGDVSMSDGVRLEVESEDFILETNQLNWRDDPRLLSSGENDEVFIFRANGTNFTGIGFNANIREHSWAFTGAVFGTFIPDDEDEEAEYGEERAPQRDPDQELVQDEPDDQIVTDIDDDDIWKGWTGDEEDDDDLLK